MTNNKSLILAKKKKDDEFYTQLSDIEKELDNYTKHFENKIVYCNTDDYRYSNFVKYFKDNFNKLKLKKLIATNYKNKLSDNAYYYIYNGNNEIINFLLGDGSFDSEECIALLDEADIVVTNPPFSLFRDFISLLENHNKTYIVIGNLNAITYNEIFKLIKDNKLWLGCNKPKYFNRPGNLVAKNMQGIGRWFTNLEHNKQPEELKLTKTYNEKEYTKYDNYDAINVDKVKDIPKDYDGVMGVPITFLDKYNSNQFEIIKFRKGNDEKDLSYTINGKIKQIYARILIKKKK